VSELVRLAKSQYQGNELSLKLPRAAIDSRNGPGSSPIDMHSHDDAFRVS
jgi:hypothetical protein